MEYIVIDLETTGLDAETCEIIEIGAVKIIDGIIEESFQTFVKPVAEIPMEITALTGISLFDVETAPDLKEAVALFENWADECDILIAHNSSFECSFLDKHLSFVPHWLDTIDIAKVVRPCERYYRLSALLPLYGLQNSDAHRAIADAQAAAELFLALYEDAQTLPLKIWRELLAVCGDLDAPLADLIRRWGNRALANRPALDIFQLDEPVERVKMVPPRNDEEGDWNWQLPSETIDAWFNERLAEAGFETRPAQLTMAHKVGEAFSQHYALVAEAGTGTGKSLAYLLPAVLYANGSRQPVLISTNTINLQEQLIDQEIPFLREHLEDDFSAVVVKGRGNYICRRKWNVRRQQAKAHNLALYLRVAHWLQLTKSGDLGELNLWGVEQEMAAELGAVSETCSSFSCDYCRKECFVTQVRQAAARADLIIVNHALLLSLAFLSEGSGILPPVHSLIIDEAHHLNQAAEKQLVSAFSQRALTRALQPLGKTDKNRELLKYMELKPQFAEAVELLKQVMDGSAAAREAGEECFVVCNDFFRSRSKGYNRQVRIVGERFNTEVWSPIENALSNLSFELGLLCKRLEQLLGKFEDADILAVSVDTLGALRMSLSSLQALNMCALAVIEGKLPDDRECVVWLEKNQFNDRAFWSVCPTDVKGMLAEHLYADKLSVVLTSATLSGENFDYFLDESGLKGSELEIETLSLPSPFDYKANCRLLLAADMPDFTRCTELEAQAALADHLYELIAASQGRALVLFTSFSQLFGVYSLIQPRLAELGITVLAHGRAGGRSQMVEALKNGEKVCLLGVNSFWEGVDIPGEALSLLVIVRLPFNPPNTPTLEARFEQLQREGKNPFAHYSLPQAIIRFRQGFGRLIRSQKDRGVVCVLDQRIIGKSYGKKFLKALPEVPVFKSSLDEMAQMIRDFLN